MFCCLNKDRNAENGNKPQPSNKFASTNSYSKGNLQNQFSNISDKETTEERKTPRENSKIDKSAKTLTNSKVEADDETVPMNLIKAAQKEKEKTVSEKEKHLQEIIDSKRRKNKIE